MDEAQQWGFGFDPDGLHEAVELLGSAAAGTVATEPFELVEAVTVGVQRADSALLAGASNVSTKM